MGSGVFWSVVGGFLAGVFARSFLALGYAIIFFLLLLASTSLALAFIERKRGPALILIAVAFVSCAGGITRMQAASMSGDLTLSSYIGENVTLDGEIVEEPDTRDTSTLLTVRISELEARTTLPVSGEVLALAPAHASVHYGDRVRVSGKLVLPEAFDTGAGRQFEYPEYLAAQGISYEVLYTKVDVEGGGGNPVIAAFLDVKEMFLRGMQAALPEPEAALAGGITVGDKRSIGPELSGVFQRDSLTHMIVLSGYNITVVLNAVAFLIRRFGRMSQFGAAVAVVTFFSVISGGASSALRAGLMALIAVVARMTHRVYLGERALAATAFVMVAWDPWTLAYDPGFQLSALATLGLILLTPLFLRWFTRVPERFGMREILASSCATQLMVLPLMLYQSGTLSLVALPANVFALLPVPAAMLFSFIAALAGFVWAPVAPLVALPAYALLWYIIAVAQFCSSLPYAAFVLPAFDAWWLLAAYGALFGGWALLRQGEEQKTVR